MQEFIHRMIMGPQPRVLGLRMRPLSLGHVHLLDLIRSPYVRGGDPTLSDLVLAAGICARTYKRGIRWLRWIERHPSAAAWLWRIRCPLPRLVRDSRRMRYYLDAWSAVPEHRREVSRDGQSHEGPLHPWWLLLVVKLAPIVGHDAVWDLPIPRATAYASALGELSGADTYISEEREEQIRRVRQIIAEREAKQKATEQETDVND